MPSLFGTTVAQNYGKIVPQQTYSTGINYTNFGTRNLRVIKVTATGATFSTGAALSLSQFSKAIRALQTVAEIYAVFDPSATEFVAVISDDTANDSDESSNAASTTAWGDAEAIIASNLGILSSAVTITTGAFAGGTLTFS